MQVTLNGCPWPERVRSIMYTTPWWGSDDCDPLYTRPLLYVNGVEVPGRLHATRQAGGGLLMNVDTITGSKP